jgi:hypothetical protein
MSWAHFDSAAGLRRNVSRTALTSFVFGCIAKFEMLKFIN